MADAKQFFFVGSDPALDLLNTTPVLASGPVDLLENYEDLTQWLTAAGLVFEQDARELRRRFDSSPAGRAALARAKSLREALRTLVIAIENGRAAPGDALAVVNQVLAAVPGYQQIVQHGNPASARFESHWRPQEENAAGLTLAPLVRAAVALLTEREQQLIRKCENPACVLHFYDTSKNHSRRWCSMEVCGNRAKAATHYRRSREGD
jgi:predicted RNA-binding Zn ribbon-like protein